MRVDIVIMVVNITNPNNMNVFNDNNKTVGNLGVGLGQAQK